VSLEVNNMIDKTSESEGMAFQILSAKIPSNKRKKPESDKNKAADFLANSIKSSKNNRINKSLGDEMRDKIYNLENEIITLQKKNIEISQKIEDNTKYVRTYVRWKRIIAAIKWGFLALIVVLGFLSFNYIFDYIKGTINEFEGQVNSIVELKNNL